MILLESLNCRLSTLDACSVTLLSTEFPIEINYLRSEQQPLDS